MVIAEHSKPSRANRCSERWSDQLSREAAVSKGLRRTLGEKEGQATFLEICEGVRGDVVSSSVQPRR